MRLVLLVASLFVSAGCTSTNIADLVAALAKDPANVCVHVGASLYVPEITISRVNMQGVSAQCANGALTTVQTPGSGLATISFPGNLTVAPK